ncbi:lamin-B2-like isoform X2 [Acanthochromis polyacanthus]|uniref:lamin-B2-like isoform X2 n=1 Tax=Acanthochromis polyacanthus TaxID=80966 RepID=UPI002234BEFF|nr:lamin-B2-like isoform X2 [Acanthochromis polyacanthus]
MFLQKTGLLLQSTITALLFCLFLTHFCKGQSQVIGPSQPIVATFGDDIILPCYLEPAYDATTVTVEWARPDLNPRFIYVSRSGHDLEKMKNPSYKGRTSMFIDELKHGNISLKISKVKPTDAGRYRCFTIELNKDTFMDLVVVSGAVPQPVTTLAGVDGKGGVELQCESAGWYPEPEVLWLDGDGNLLSAGPTETVRGPDDLYTVSSRVTVEKKHSNKFTCRVQQNNINQSRETQIHVPDDFFIFQSSNTSTIVGSAVCLVVSIILLILAVVLFVHTRRQNRTKRRKDVQVKSEEGVELMSDNTVSMKTLENKKQPESKRMEKEYDDIIKQLHQEKEERKKAENKVTSLKNELEKLKEEELNQKEQQRRKEAENAIQRLKEKLDMKKTEVKNKQTELQSLQEEKKKIQDDLQNLNKDLDTKITELKTIREELAKFFRLSFSSGKWKKKEDEKRIQTEIENLNKQLMTKNMEFQNKDKKSEEERVELKELLDDQQKMETELQIEEQKLKEYDDIIKPLQQETEERKKAENKVKMLKNDLKELEKKLKENEKKWMETERELEGKSSETNNQLQQEKEEKKKAENEVKTLKNELEELKRNNSETDNQLQQEKQKNETLNSRLEELEKLQDEKQKWMKTERELRGNYSETFNQLQQEKQKNETLNSRLEELQNEKKMATESVGELSTELENENKELEEISRTNSVSGRSTISPITVEEVHQNGLYIRLKNISSEEINLGDWKLKLLKNNRETDAYTIKESFKLQAGGILCISSQRYPSKPPGDVKQVWLDMMNWSPADKLQIYLISNNGETFRLL